MKFAFASQMQKVEVRMETKKFICINCPIGCHLSVQINHDDGIQVSGNRCPRGAAYAKQETTSPQRTLTCLMRVADRSAPLSVKTSIPIPKNLLYSCTNCIYEAIVTPPVKTGDVIIHNILDTGADVIATRDIL